METLTQDRLKEVLHYNPDTGIFTWKIANSNRVKAGDIAGSLGDRGYLIVKIDGKSYKTHRLAFLYMEGYFPEYGIDHKNGNKSDNRWKELRHVSHSCNMQNQKISKNNSSGFRGVYKRGGTWTAQVKVNYKHICIGNSYTTALEAALARQEWEKSTPGWTCDERGVNDKAIEEALVREKETQQKLLEGKLPWL